MPISRYFKGKGHEVMESMTKEYGEEKGKKVFYATANKKGLKPGKPKMSLLMQAAMGRK
jgi:hypothetical protein